MAETAVAALKLSIDLITLSTGLDFGVRSQVSKIKLELERMRSFLRDAERYKDGNEGLCSWMTQVRDAALKAEDVLDEFLYHLHSAKQDGFIGFLHKAVIFPEEMWKRQRMVARLKEIKHEIKEIAKRSQRYDLSHIEEDPSSRQSMDYAQIIREISFLVEAAEVVGLE